MIAYIEGVLLVKREKYSIINTKNDIGYKVKLKSSYSNNLKENSKVSLFIYSHIREDAFDLFGFETIEELDFFETLLSVKGIGPKVAMEIINFDINLIKTAIIEKNHAIISKIPGIGKKSAERIILELKEKVNIDTISNFNSSINLENENSEDLIFALVNLGFNRNHVVNTLSKIPNEIKTDEEKIKYFLQNK